MAISRDDNLSIDALRTFDMPAAAARPQTARQAASLIESALSRQWAMVDGPAAATFMARTKQGPDIFQQYRIVDAFGGHGHQFNIREWTIPTVPDLELLIRWMPIMLDGILKNFMGASPAADEIVWRVHPQIEFHEAANGWAFYARLATKPKEAWFLDMEPGDKENEA